MTQSTPKHFPAELMDRTLAYIERVGDMILHLELLFARPLDLERLAHAALLTLEAEPILCCRLVQHWRAPYWEQIAVLPGELVTVAQSAAAYETFKIAPIDTARGPRLKLCTWDAPEGTYLLLKVCHYVADAAGVKVVAGVLARIYNQLKHSPGYRPVPNLSAARGVTQILRAVPWHSYPRLYMQFIQDQLANQYPRGTQNLAIPSGPAVALTYVKQVVAADDVAQLIDYGRRQQATVNDLLLAAFFRALAHTSGWSGDKQLRINTTVDFRRYLPQTTAPAVANLSASVQGWPNMGTELGADFAATLQRIVAITRKRKANFVGVDALVGLLLSVGMMPHSVAKGWIKQVEEQQVAQGNLATGITNMGPIEAADVTFDEQPRQAHLLPPPLYPPYFLMGATGYNGTLTLSFGAHTLQRAVGQQFLAAMIDQLKQVNNDSRNKRTNAQRAA